MLIFIDEKTGRRYSTPDQTTEGDGSVIVNHTFRFDDQQSIGLFYQKRLFFLSDSSSVTVSIPSNDIFFLYDTESIEGSSVNLTDIKTFSLTLTGEAVGGYYLYCVNVGCTSATVGEYTEEIVIGDSIYNISADFYGQQEELEILLHNQGVNLPRDIQRAFYDTNVHNTTTDWIMLNRKYKEFLLNVMDILYKKGSYQSLISSLDWFEYGDAIKLYEFWSTPKISTLYQHELTTLYTDALKELVSMYRKTTFVAISLSLDELKISDGYLEYSTNENGEKLVPLTEDILHKWSREDLMLKMTLLGNYFSTYFMPIHLDLLYSSVENIIFDAIKIKTYSSGVGTCTSINDIGGDVIRIKNNKEYVIGDVYISRGDKIKYLSEIPLPASMSSLGQDAEKMYIGRGAVAEFDIEVNNIYGAPTSHYSKIITNIEGVYREYPVDLQSTIDSKGNIIYPHTTIKIFIESSGVKNIGINLVSYCGCFLAGSTSVEIIQPQYNDFITKKLVRLTINEVSNKVRNHDNLSFPTPTIPTSLERNRLVLADECLHDISACFVESSSNVFYLCRNWKGTDADVYTEVALNNIESIRTELFQAGWIIYTKDVNISTHTGTMVYMLKVNIDSNIYYTVRPTDNHTDNRKKYVVLPDRHVLYFNERRFVSCLWKETRYDLTAPVQDAVFRCVPNGRLLPNSDIRWIIKNITTGEVGVVKDLQEPIFWCNSISNSKIDKRGTYSIALKVNNSETLHRYEFRVV